MALVIADRPAGRRFAVLACALVVLALALVWSAGAEAAVAKKSDRGCAHCKATGSRSGRSGRSAGKGKAASMGKAGKGHGVTRGKGPTAASAAPSTAAVSAATVAPAATPTAASAPSGTVVEPTSGVGIEIGEAIKVEVGTPSPPASAGCSSSGAASVAVGLGTFSAVVRPSSCWRPYSAGSPFNTLIDAAAGSSSSSAAQVSRLLSGGAINYFVAGDPARDWGTAVYYPDSSDPTYVIHCTEAWGPCPLEGLEVHLPAGATPSGPWPIGGGDADSHMTIVDQATGWEYDLWDVREIGGGRIVTKWGGKTQIEGSGLGSDAVAAQFGTLAGMIRPDEMRAGKIDHALALTVPCTEGFVAPATKGGLECGEAGMPTEGALPMGAHLQLQMSAAEIEALSAPAWKKGILRAFATYGAFVEDTTGDSSQWGLKFESPNGSTSLGGPDEYVELAKSLGMEAADYNGNGYPEYWFNIASGVDWSKLRVLG